MMLRVLGPVEAHNEQGQIKLSSRETSVLGVLLLHANAPCSVDMLIRDVWDDHGLVDPGNTVRQVISSLRQKLRPDSLIVTAGTRAYKATPPPGDLDMHRFEALLSTAATLAGAGQRDQEVKVLEDILALWPNPHLGFPDLGDSLAVLTKTEQLTEQRHAAETRLMDLYLALGCHDKALPMMRARCVANPVCERAWAQLVRGLILCRRHGEAIEAYHKVRGALANLLGAYPGPELQTLLNCAMDGGTPDTEPPPTSLPGVA